VFTARYALSSYIKQIRFVFKGLNNIQSKEMRILKQNGHLVDLGNDNLTSGTSEFMASGVDPVLYSTILQDVNS
jgi:hypothetical protein